MSIVSFGTACRGECCVCGAGSACLAGHGDDDYFPASKDQVIARLDQGSYARYRDEMIKYLKDNFNYDYEKEKK